MEKSDIAVVGLAVMGKNIVLNMADNGFKITAYNRTKSKTDIFLSQNQSNKNIIGAYSIKEIIESLKSPKCIMLMIQSEAVDYFIKEIQGYLDEGDIIIDGGNSNFKDTEKRINILNKRKILYIGMGISGGEEGARFGPSIMPGGNIEAWHQVKYIFKTIAGKTKNGSSCCSWIGNGGSGHFVKMVHNGIEYGDMQIICEIYQFMKVVLDLNNSELSDIFNQWNKTELKSYLIEITSNILNHKDITDRYTIDSILDVAGQKGTGKWTGINALELGTPLTLITESVFTRFISTKKNMRLEAHKIYNKKNSKLDKDDKILHQLKQALLFAKIISYTQGYMLMKEASDQYDWSLKYGNIALAWQEGCIIRSVFLEKINLAFIKNPQLSNLIFDSYFEKLIKTTLPDIKSIVIKGIEHNVAMPALNSALNFFNSIITKKLPANLLQAQRDYFGAHQYERTDMERGKYFHTEWLSKK